MKEENGRACCFSGHRDLSEAECETLPLRLEGEIRRAAERGYRDFLVGGARGFDTLAAEAVVRLRDEGLPIRLFLLLPCRGQADGWSAEERARYQRLLREADGTEWISERYFRGCMQKRDRALVDRSDLCLAYLRKKTGGTAYTVGYAERRGISVLRLAEEESTTAE